MQQSSDQTRAPKARSSLWSKPSSRWLLGIPVGGLLMLVLGIVIANAFAYTMDATSTPQFCANACHYFRDFVKPEVASSVHGRNGPGVAATCPDCHLPERFVPKMKRKIESAREIWGHMTGVINTREKFEAHRLAMAQRVWAEMKETDSRECRTCHAFSRMDFDEQERFAARKHQAAMKEGGTCIDCHKGVAHTLPPGYDEEGAQNDSEAQDAES